MVRAWLEKRDLYSGHGSDPQLEFSHLQRSAFLLGLPRRFHEVRPIECGGSTLQMSPVFIGRVSRKENFRQALFNFSLCSVSILPHLIGQLQPSSTQRNVFVLHSL